MDTFGFCPNSQVVETLVRDGTNVITLNSWQFSAKPNVPYQRRFKVTLHGLKWYLNNITSVYDSTTAPTVNARALELFYQANETWNPFLWVHPHLGVTLTCRFMNPVNVPAGLPNTGGLLGPLELNFIEHNPGF